MRILIICSFLITIASAKVMTECELAEELELNGFPVEQLPDWICLAKSESSLNTTAIGGPNRNGSFDFGIFQINETWWCNNKRNHGRQCNVKCKDLILEDSIIPSIACAKLIYKVQGFSAWHGWTAKCKGKVLSALSCNYTSNSV